MSNPASILAPFSVTFLAFLISAASATTPTRASGRAASPAKKIVITPTPGGKLTGANVRYESIRGRIETAWKKSGDKLTLAVTIPANTTAAVLVPAKSADAITESVKPLAKSPGVKFLRMDGDRAVLEVEAGSYRFASVMGRLR